MTVQEQWEKVRDAGPRALTFVNEVWAEMKKVYWPGRKETYAATIVVLAATVIVAIFLGVVDSVISHLVQAILS